jgi:hypothetical protein
MPKPLRPLMSASPRPSRWSRPNYPSPSLRLVPTDLRIWSRERRRAAGVSQQEIASRIGISRPRLANAEAGRFGLSTEAAARFLGTIAGLPERQLELGF